MKLSALFLVIGVTNGFSLNTRKPLRIKRGAPLFGIDKVEKLGLLAESCLDEDCPVDEVATLRNALIREKAALIEQTLRFNKIISKMTALEIELAGAVSTDDDGFSQFTELGKKTIPDLVKQVQDVAKED
mmetsp:Transcript_25264/g.34645  ORF Transcript_25264/g.34645 Transcript_25264/m.34645 type:complete len:130 (-) Transcript_25264:166-555(-)|eukprot:CAMPEP_0185751546 /NCGR_PEP_ID=MMETSP1174-20130828/10328_1 /TAXON_ID=35687 /ORGANISM="Dictyocha speculum, Strain CCMP1381" /LENGTH=129 /DNA_ID=CAMNT_0028428581 /DNA_START=40 /DNA_END=429 /DNA_ORIENTATION=-